MFTSFLLSESILTSVCSSALTTQTASAPTAIATGWPPIGTSAMIRRFSGRRPPRSSLDHDGVGATGDREDDPTATASRTAPTATAKRAATAGVGSLRRRRRRRGQAPGRARGSPFSSCRSSAPGSSPSSSASSFLAAAVRLERVGLSARAVEASISCARRRSRSRSCGRAPPARGRAQRVGRARGRHRSAARAQRRAAPRAAPARPSERIVEIGQRRPTPERQRLSQLFGRVSGRGLRVPDQPLECSRSSAPGSTLTR